MMKLLAVRLAEEIKGNRAVVITRNQLVQQKLAEVFKPFKMIRFLANSPLAVADATRNAAVMAERVQIRTTRAEEHTSELQSLMRRSYAVFCLKKKTTEMNRVT